MSPHTRIAQFSHSSIRNLRICFIQDYNPSAYSIVKRILSSRPIVLYPGERESRPIIPEIHDVVGTEFLSKSCIVYRCVAGNARAGGVIPLPLFFASTYITMESVIW